MKIQNFRLKILFLFLIIILVVTRFYDTLWGSPFFFHPDERNIASSISQLRFPSQLNPHFFAYGSLPIYLTYTIGVLVNALSATLHTNNVSNIFFVSFETAVFVLRMFSALLSIGVSLLLFYFSKRLIKQQSYLPFVLSIFSVGLIQYAHFGTFEMFLTFFSLLLYLSLTNYITTQKTRYFWHSSVVFALLVAIKISSLFLLPLLLLAIIISQHKKIHFFHIALKGVALPVLFLQQLIQIILVTTVVFLISSPFTILDFLSFTGSINYESSVATGTLLVFYTGSFFDTIPVLFQFKNILPFLINPFVLITFTCCFIYLSIKGVLKKDTTTLFLLTFFLILFLSNSLLFVKWTRYLLPSLPFIYLIIGFALNNLFRVLEQNYSSVHIFKPLILCLIITTGVIHSFSFIKTVYLDQDTRLQAVIFAQKSIPKESRILSEVYDIGIIPFNSQFNNISLFNFYDLDSNASSLELKKELSDHEYLILPSQRIYKSRINNPKKFPLGNAFYSSLNSNDFTLVYKTPCDIFCKITYLGDPVFALEETTNVFDRPNVMIYKINN